MPGVEQALDPMRQLGVPEGVLDSAAGVGQAERRSDESLGIGGQMGLSVAPGARRVAFKDGLPVCADDKSLILADRTGQADPGREDEKNPDR